MLYVEETLVTRENLMMSGERSKASDVQAQGILLPLFIATDLYIYTLIGINNHSKRMFFIMCQTKMRNKKKQMKDNINKAKKHFREKSLLKV